MNTYKIIEQNGNELDVLFDALKVAERVAPYATTDSMPIVQEYVNHHVGGIFNRIYDVDSDEKTVEMWFAIPDKDRALCLAGLVKAISAGYDKAKPEYLPILGKGIPHLDLVKAARGE